MKICIIVHGYPSFGAATSIVPALSREFKKSGHQCLVFAPELKNKECRHPEVETYWFGWFGRKNQIGKLRNPISIISLIKNGKKEIFRFAKEKGIDLCIALWTIPGGYFAWYVKNKLNIPYCVWALGADIWTWARIPFIKGVIKKVLYNADYIFADGYKLLEDVERLSGRRGDFLPTARSIEAQGRRDESKDFNGPTKFLFIGRFEKAKGIDILLEAMEQLQLEGAKAKLFVFGQGSLNNKIYKIIKDKGMADNVILGGYADEITLKRYLKECDCMVIPSRIESIPVILSDAVQSGINIIASDVGDLGDVVKRYNLGEVCLPNIYDLKEKMKNFIKDKKGASKNSDPIKREEFLSLFNPQNIVKTILSKIESR